MTKLYYPPFLQMFWDMEIFGIIVGVALLAANLFQSEGLDE